jgi:hypothetical protein
MIWKCRWLAIGLALSFTGLACSRIPMDEQQGMNTISPSGGAGTVTSGGSTGTVGGRGGITGAGGNKCTTGQNTCATDDDCTTSDYRPPISSAADCYCFACGYAVSKTMAVDCQSAYDQFCGLNWQLEHGCEPPPCFPGMGGARAGYYGLPSRTSLIAQPCRSQDGDRRARATALSATPSLGRFLPRRRMLTWCRSTAFSTTSSRRERLTSTAMPPGSYLARPSRTSLITRPSGSQHADRRAQI